MKDFMSVPELNRREEQGLVKAFEYTYELAWNTLKDFLEYQGVGEIVIIDAKKAGLLPLEIGEELRAA